MASATAISLQFLGIDATANTFRAIGGRIDGLNKTVAGFSAKALAFGKAMMAALPVGLFAGRVTETINALGTLSDRAADAGTSAPALQKLTGALQQIGVRGASLDMVSKAMQNMTRLTGETGAEGFAKVLGQASRLSTETERLTFLSEAFGRQQGAAFAAIVRGGEGAVSQLVELAAGYPAISDASVNTADRAADAMLRASDAIKAGWGEMVVSMVEWVEGVFGPLPEVAANAAKGIMNIFKGVTDSIRTVVAAVRIPLETVARTVAAITLSISAFTEAITSSDYSFSDALADSRMAFEDQFTDMRDWFTETADSLFDFSDVAAMEETKPLFDNMRKAIGEGGVTFRKEAEKAKDSMAEKSGPQKGGTWAVEGSAAALAIIRGDRQRLDSAAADQTVARTLPTIADSLRRIADSTSATNEALDELEAI